jgi:hypothetical protein
MKKLLILLTFTLISFISIQNLSEAASAQTSVSIVIDQAFIDYIIEQRKKGNPMVVLNVTLPSQMKIIREQMDMMRNMADELDKKQTKLDMDQHIDKITKVVSDIKRLKNKKHLGKKLSHILTDFDKVKKYYSKSDKVGFIKKLDHVETEYMKCHRTH